MFISLRKAPFVWLQRRGLTLILLFTYLLLTLTVMEQSRTIENQRRLIRQLFSDSQELNALRLEQSQEQPR